jgi:hypothetical protein
MQHAVYGTNCSLTRSVSICCPFLPDCIYANASEYNYTITAYPIFTCFCCEPVKLRTIPNFQLFYLCSTEVKGRGAFKLSIQNTCIHRHIHTLQSCSVDAKERGIFDLSVTHAPVRMEIAILEETMRAYICWVFPTYNRYHS